MRRRTKKKNDRRIVIDRYRCAYCGACISVCKYNANELVETFLSINEDECNTCMTCIRVCPMKALSLEVKK
jgi:ferredoxin